MSGKRYQNVMGDVRRQEMVYERQEMIGGYKR